MRSTEPKAVELARLGNIVPAGEWVSYGDLAAAYNHLHGTKLNARNVAMLLTIAQSGYLREKRPGGWDRLNRDEVQQSIDTWVVPWHRIRLADGTQKSYDDGELTGLHRRDWDGEMFRAEGGVMNRHRAMEACRFDIVGAVGGERAQGRSGAPNSSAPPPSSAVEDLIARRRLEFEQRFLGDE